VSSNPLRPSAADTARETTKVHSPDEDNAPAPLAEGILHAIGLDCRHCVSRITRALERVEGAQHASEDYDAQRATVTYDPNRTDPRRFIDAIILEGANRGQSFDAEILAIRSVNPTQALSKLNTVSVP